MNVYWRKVGLYSWTVEDTSFLCPKKKMASIGGRYTPSNYNNMMMIKVMIVITVIIAIIANNETAMLSGEMQRNTKNAEKHKKMQRNAEKCREMQRIA